jgi:hypothetical protein
MERWGILYRLLPDILLPNAVLSGEVGSGFRAILRWWHTRQRRRPHRLMRRVHKQRLKINQN